jgi:hypothetical protein
MKAARFVRSVLQGKPELIVHQSDLPATAAALCNLLAATGCFFERKTPVKMVPCADGGPMTACPLTVNSVVVEAHHLCQPITFNSNGEKRKVTLPDRVARMYLDMRGEWNLPALTGISTAPLLSGDGRIRRAIGYDRTSGLWCCKVPKLHVPKRPQMQDAAAALHVLRVCFKTFPFADAASKYDPVLRVEVVDLGQPPGRDEGAFLAGLLTAICRPSLWLAPGLLIVAPELSGCGSGKGLLVRAIFVVAFGIRPRALTPGHDRQELDKRIVSALVEAAPGLFLDNVNSTILRSPTLASVLTERPAQVRILGRTGMVPLNSTAFIAATGNGLTVSEDLARRFNFCELDACCEDAESHSFAPGFLSEIEQRRSALLSAGLTIWRFGRQNAASLQRGRPLGSYEIWCEWVRDPLLTLGCCDPVERIRMVKARDPKRQQIAEFFRTWHVYHGEVPVKAAGLAGPVRHIIDPHGRGRQYVVTRLGRLAGTRAAGFVLTRQDPVGVWGAATYALRQVAPEPDDSAGHRDHRDHGIPVPPVPDESEILPGPSSEDGEIPPEGELLI